jgi:death-on-curing protein
MLKVIGNYSKALNLLDDYDHKTLKLRKENISDKVITYQDCKNLINTLRFNEESDVLG